jgi:uncharacterized protein YlxP (DUF503 family)
MEERMVTAVMVLTLEIPEAHSLKEKRRVVKSLIDQLRSRFNLSVIEADEQDLHQRAVIAAAALAAHRAQADSILDNVLNFVQDNCDAMITQVQREIN